MALNQVMRYAGFALGSALAAAIMEANAPAGAGVSTSTGFTVIGLTACGVSVVTAGLTWLLPGRPAPQPPSAAPRDSGDTIGTPTDSPSRTPREIAGSTAARRRVR